MMLHVMMALRICSIIIIVVIVVLNGNAIAFIVDVDLFFFFDRNQCLVRIRKARKSPMFKYLIKSYT
jgi:uncharacterized membrane protein YqjE